MANDLMIEKQAICFGERLASSVSFKTLFHDGMSLVEETAAYLDGEGRLDAKRLPRLSALAYASESMRLTTRLMQIASWLLLQRAVNEGEMSQSEASSDKRRTRIAWQTTHKSEAAAGLPARLIVLIEGSLQLQERIARLDRMISAPEPTPMPALESHPLADQMSRLRDAFC